MKSIKTKVTLYVGSLLLLVCIGFGIISYMTSSNALLSNVKETLPQLALQTSKTIQSRVEGQLNVLETIASNEIISDNTIKLESKLFFLTSETSRNKYIRMGIADKDGKLTSANGSVSDINNTDYFKKAISGQKLISDPIISKADNSVVLIYAVPIKSNNQVTGVLIAAADGYVLCDITSDIKFGKTGKAFMINKNGTTIAHTNRDLVKNMDNDFESVKKEPKLKTLVELEKQMVEGKLGAGEYEYNGIVKYLGFAPVANTEWFVAVAAPKTEVLSGLKTLTLFILIASILFLLVSLGGGCIIANIISKPITAIAEHLKVLSTGDFTKEISQKLLNSKDELGVLAKSTDSMQKSVREVIKNVMLESKNVEESVEASNKSILELNREVEEISASTEELSSGMEETAASTEEMNATSLEIEKVIESITLKAQESAASSEGINKKATELRQNFLSSQESAIKIFAEVKGKLEKALDESKAVEQINVLADTIMQITSQTNLLALNAAIESARAGEAGKGFAVVADEIRKLAENSQSIVKQIQHITNQVVSSVDNLSTSANSVLQFIAKDVNKDYKTMLNATEEYKKDAEFIDTLASDFSATSEELAASIENMIKAINEITDATNEGMKESSDIAEKTVVVAQKADEVVRQVSIPKDSIDKLIKLVDKFKI